MSATKQEIFEYIRDNLRLSVNGPRSDFGWDGKVIDFKLVLSDPNGKDHEISSDQLLVRE